ncbi:MAG: hypothetical protein A3A94_00010 [Candidatus Portnoybacteria bacterium RIFCSPLOWO2_01_FULL_43_11]|uniref:Endolytic murein transglycosylase n=2 Tax=Candidatus Portnoyibacteriota TaxID=1817913 RepID=A0A1G2FDA4_9BACT|nr:MAG: hypothetical protein A2815_01420 [Candidatus Portnoybacteria bacterium RIFCSPHIGHO2_01_FULL_40_12b]OGZ38468.1 MAG: hypothetical protein A3A94_00010 [Candidatus Portnoybacteria bacterium RIFCSPLOWO2_01_FULL_43_11]
MNKYIKILLFLIIFSGLLTGGYFFILNQINTPVSGQFKEQSFVIEKGESLKEISEHLEKEGLINQDYWFKFYVLGKGWAGRLQAGEYTLSPSMSILEIAENLAEGKTISDISITIPEGFTLKQIDSRLTQVGLIDKGGLLNFNQKEFLILNSQFSISNLEGFLFPDTYKFRKDNSLEEIIRKILNNFDKKLSEDLRAEIQKQRKNIFEIITLASIVQNEALTNEEMPVIAGVFSNRLTIGLPLQSDATINYITGKNLRQPSIKDTEVNSLYNTYLHKGLPPGPISNPGLDAIKAAIYPQKTDYFYFLHPLNGPTVFSKTLKEHNSNKAKYLP